MHKHPCLKRDIKQEWDRRINHKGITESEMRLAVCVMISLLFWQFRYCETMAEGICVHTVVCYPDCDPCSNSNDTNKRKRAGREKKKEILSENSSPCSPIFALLSSLICALSLLWRIVPLCCTIKPNNSNIITAISDFSLLPFPNSNILTFLSTLKTPPCLVIFYVSVMLCVSEMNTSSRIFPISL